MNRPARRDPFRRFGFGRQRKAREVRDEAAFHLERLVDELVAEGMAPDAARLEAERRFGDVERHVRACLRIEERRVRRERRGEIMRDLIRDLRFALRSFRRSPGFIAVAVATLALGIGANVTIFGMINGVVLTPLPYGDADDLVLVWTTKPAQGMEKSSTSPSDFVDWRRRNRVFESMAAHAFWEANHTGVERPARLTGYRVTGNLFEVLDVDAALGRTLTPGDDRPDANPVVVLSHRAWKVHFGADPELPGRTIELDGIEHSVIGVMPEEFAFPQFQFAGDFWVPLRLTEAQMIADYGRGRRFLTVTARLADGVTVEEAGRDMMRVAEELEEEFGGTNVGLRPEVIGIQAQMAEPIRPALLILPAMVAFVLLICCANVANLFLARGSARRGEIAVRLALGAGRGRLVRQLLAESLLVAAFGGVGGTLLSLLAEQAVAASIPDFVSEVMPSAVSTGFDHRIWLFTVAVTLVAAVLFGLVPALRATRPGLQQTLAAASGRMSDGRSGNRLRSVLVVSEVAGAVVLLLGAALMIKGFVGLLRVDPGFDPDSGLTMALSLPEEKYPDDQSRRRFFDDVLQRVRATPGVISAGAANLIPMNWRDSTSNFRIEGEPVHEAGEQPIAGYRSVTAGYLETMEIPLRAGRTFDGRDDAESPSVAIVNETLARRHFPDGDVLGRRIRMGDSDNPWMEIVGVVGDVRFMNLNQTPEREIYVPFRQWPEEGMNLVARTGPEPMSLADTLRKQVWAVDPDQPVDDVQTLQEIVSVSLFVFRMPVNFATALALAALLLAAVGLYGVLAYLVAQRRHEIGVRIALGARRGQVTRLVAGRAVLLTTVGLVIGLALGFGLAQILAALFAGVEGTEASIFAGVAVLLLAVSLLAAWIPARRAAAVDPLVALRAE